MLANVDADFEVLPSAAGLDRVGMGRVVLLRVVVEELRALNLARQLLADRRLRVVLWAESGTEGAVATQASDLWSWVQAVVDAPAGPPRFVVEGLDRAARWGWVAWNGPGRAGDAVRAALPNRQVVFASAAQEWPEIVDALRSAPAGAVVDWGRLDAWAVQRVEWAHAQVGGLVALMEGQAPPGWWPVRGEVEDLGTATLALERAGVARAGRVAASLELEPEAIAAARGAPPAREVTSSWQLRRSGTELFHEAAAAGNEAAGWRLGAELPPPPPSWATERRSAGRVAAALASGATHVSLTDTALAHGQVDIARSWAEQGSGPEHTYAMASICLVEGRLAEAERLLDEVLTHGNVDPAVLDAARLDRARLTLWSPEPDEDALQREASVAGEGTSRALHRARACATLADLAVGRWQLDRAGTWAARALDELVDDLQCHGAVYVHVVAARVAMEQGRNGEAIDRLRGVLDGFTTRIGHQSHPQALDAARALARALRQSGHPEAALGVLVSHRPDRVGLVATWSEVMWLGAVGRLEAELGRAESAAQRYRRALELEEALVGAHGPFRASLATGLAATLLSVGNLEEAMRAAAMAVDAALVAGTPPALSRAQITLALARRMSGAPDAALARRAHAVATSALDRADALVELGMAEHARGRHRAAVRALERAVRALHEAGSPGAQRLPVVLRLLEAFSGSESGAVGR